MAERDRLRLLCGLAAAPLVLPRTARADDGVLLRIMLQVLAGDLTAALDATRQLAGKRGHPDARDLLVELTDMARGDYATKGNRAFPRFAPLWRRARREWLDTQRPPVGALPASALSLPASVDGGPGKQLHGDRRTPVGTYWIDDELETSRLPARYGSRALALDYPNALDRRQGRKGGGIWIHGMDPANNIRPPRDTDGCVAVTEERIGALADALDPRTTPVIISERLAWRSPADGPAPVLAALDAALAEWLAARTAGDAERVLALYDDSFSRAGMEPAVWRSWRRRAMASDAVAAVSAESVAHFAETGLADTYVTRFRQVLRPAEGGAAVTTWQRLYWHQKKGRLRIVAQSAG